VLAFVIKQGADRSQASVSGSLLVTLVIVDFLDYVNFYLRNKHSSRCCGNVRTEEIN